MKYLIILFLFFSSFNLFAQIYFIKQESENTSNIYFLNAKGKKISKLTFKQNSLIKDFDIYDKKIVYIEYIDNKHCIRKLDINTKKEEVIYNKFDSIINTYNINEILYNNGKVIYKQNKNSFFKKENQIKSIENEVINSNLNNAYNISKYLENNFIMISNDNIMFYDLESDKINFITTSKKIINKRFPVYLKKTNEIFFLGEEINSESMNIPQEDINYSTKGIYKYNLLNKELIRIKRNSGIHIFLDLFVSNEYLYIIEYLNNKYQLIEYNLVNNEEKVIETFNMPIYSLLVINE